MAAAHEQHERQEVDVWRDAVLDWMDNPTGRIPEYGKLPAELKSTADRIYLPEILYHCLTIPVKDQKHRDKIRVSRVLSLAKYKKKREEKANEFGKRPEFWVNPD